MPIGGGEIFGNLVHDGKWTNPEGKNFQWDFKKAKIDIENLWEYDIIIPKSSGAPSAVIKKG